MSKQNAPDAMVDTVISYMKHGLRPVPIVGGQKRPRPLDWQRGNFFTDEPSVRRYYAANPDDGVGLVAGEQSGWFAVDVDIGHGGLESLDALIAEHGDLPPTPTARTGSGGSHLFFAYPQGRKIKNRAGVKPGVDIRGGYVDDDGSLVGTGQIVVEPSLHPTTGEPYRWIISPLDTPFAEAPEWLVDLVESPGLPRSFTDTGRIPPGQRHDFLMHHAARLRGLGYDAEDIEGMLEGLFRTRCEQVPPLDADEISKIATWIGAKREGEDPEAWPQEWLDRGFGKRLFQRDQDESDDARWKYTGESISLGKTKFRAVQLSWHDGFTKLDYAPRRWWWNDRLAHPASILNHADAKLGKTDTLFALLDAATKEAPFLGDFVLGMDPRILYLEEEGAANMQERLRAVGWGPDRCKFISVDDVYGLDWMTLAASVVDEAARDGRNLVVVDTMSVFLGLGAEEKTNLFSYGSAFKPIFAYGKRAGVSMWINHHDNAGGSVYRRNEVAAHFDHLIHHVFDANTGLDTWEFTGRYSPKSKPLPITYQYDNSTGARNLVSGAMAHSTPTHRGRYDDLINYLEMKGEGTVKDFMGIGIPRASVQRLLEEMDAQHMLVIEEVRSTAGGKPGKVYRLAP